MTRPLRVFLGDYVPLSNKGEEAIVRGIQDMLSEGQEDVEIIAFGPECQPAEYGSIRIFPYDWVFATRLLDFARHKLQRLSTWTQLRLGIYGRIRRLVRSRDPRYAELAGAYRQADLVLVGHDGFFCPESSAILHLARLSGKRCGILGSGFNRPRSLALVEPLYRRAIEDSGFCVFRERAAYKFMRALAPGSPKITLEPDPAFAMWPAHEGEVDALLQPMAWYRRAQASGRPIVAVTVCEKSAVYRCSFVREANPTRKRQVHTSFLASLLDALVDQRHAQIVFLPHSIEAGVGNDVDVARRVAGSMASNPDYRAILDGDYSSRLLKGIIRRADFCVGERTHSLIGSLSVATPFIGLTNSSDRRTHDILGDMGQCEDLLLDMDDPSQDSAIARVLRAYDGRDAIHQRLERISEELARRLRRVAALVRGA